MRFAALPMSLLLFCVSACTSTHPHSGTPQAATTTDATSPTPAGELRFSGIVEKVDTGCYADGVCLMIIAGREVVFGRGWSHDTWGEVATMEPTEAYLGRWVDVYCKGSGKQCTLAGSAGYFIRPRKEK